MGKTLLQEHRMLYRTLIWILAERSDLGPRKHRGTGDPSRSTVGEQGGVDVVLGGKPADR